MDAQGFERSYTVNSSILLAIQPHLIHFHQLLLQPPKVYEINKDGSQLRSYAQLCDSSSCSWKAKSMSQTKKRYTKKTM